MPVTLIHHWAFDENTGSTVEDAVSSNTGTANHLNGTDMWWTTGRGTGYAMGCNGQVLNDFDFVSTENEVASGGIGDFAIAVWLKQSAKASGTIVQMENTQTGVIGGTPSTTNGNALFLEVGGGGTTQNINFAPSAYNNRITYDCDFGDGEWHHVVAAWCNGVTKLWVDNSLVETGSDNEYTEAGYWRIFGTKIFGGTSYPYTLTGVIDDVKIFTGCVTDCIVDALFNDLDPSVCDKPHNAIMFSCNT